MSDKKLLAVEIDIYQTERGQKGVLCITKGLVVLLYKTSMSVVVNPFMLDDVAVMHLAENLPSAAALELTD
jgi:hypothetical protein